jgi:hypothetical protein
LKKAKQQVYWVAEAAVSGMKDMPLTDEQPLPTFLGEEKGGGENDEGRVTKMVMTYTILRRMRRMKK